MILIKQQHIREIQPQIRFSNTHTRWE